MVTTSAGALKAPALTPKKPAHAKRQSVIEDDFGDFSQQNDVFEDVDFGDFAGGAGGSKTKNLMDMDIPLPSRPTGARSSGFFAFDPAPKTAVYASGPGRFYTTYKAHHTTLLPLCLHLRSTSSPSSTLSLLFPPSPQTSLPPPLTEQADRLLALLLFLGPELQPLHDWGFLRQALLLAGDRFDSICLVAFEVADGKGDEAGMRSAASSSWKVFQAGGGRRDEWECGRVWIEKREVFYEKGKWDAAENIMWVQVEEDGS
jgi:recyclin-1